SFQSTPACFAASATLRYIAPVSTSTNPSASARRRATVLFPAPAGPSIATMGRARAVTTNGLSRLRVDAGAERAQRSDEPREARRDAVAIGDLRRSARGEREDRGGHRDAVVAAAVDLGGLESTLFSLDHETVGQLLAFHAQRAQHMSHRRDPIALLDAQLLPF